MKAVITLILLLSSLCLSAQVTSLNPTAVVSTTANYSGRAQIIYDGNSLWQGEGSSHKISSTTDFTPGPFPSRSQAVLVSQFQSATFTAFNFGVGGQTTAQMLSDVVTQVDGLYSPAIYDRQIVVPGEVTNQLANGSGFTAQQAIDNYVLYCKGRRAKGFSVVATTVLPRTSLFTGISAGDFETARTIVNNYLRANYLQFADVLADIASVPGVTYPDGTHPNDAGYILIGNYVASKIAPLLVTGFNPQSIPFLIAGTIPTSVTTSAPTSSTTPVVFLRGQGANNSTAIVDDGTPSHTFSALNTAKISTTQFKYGTSSLFFDGGLGTYINTPSSTDFDIGSGDFTLEAWVYKTNAGTGFPPLFTRGDNIGNQWNLCFPNAGARLEFFVATTSSNYVAQGLSTTTDFPLTTWVHVALVSKDGVRRLYQNGVLVGTATTNTPLESNPTGRPFKVGFLPALGSDATAGDRFNGYMQFVKLTKAALYTAAFTPPAY